METVTEKGRQIAGFLAVLVALGIAHPTSAQQPPAPPGEEPPAPPSPAGQEETKPPIPLAEESVGTGEGSIELIGPPLYPFYDHYRRLDDGTEVLNLLYLYHSTWRPSGDRSVLLAPFYYWQRQLEPRDHRLFLFPLLYFHRSSDALSYDIWPLFYDLRRPDERHRFLFPFWYQHRDDSAGSDTHHILFPLARYRSQTEGEESTSAFRFGLWKLLEFFENFKSGETSRTSVLNLFNFGSEAESPFSLYRHVERRNGPDAIERSTHLFPLYWSGESAERSYRWLLPFFGYDFSGPDRDVYLPALLSRFGSSDSGEVRRDILFPFYSRSFGPGFSKLRAFPLFSYEWTPERRRWGLLNVLFRDILYSNEYYPESGKTAHSILWPLGRYDVEPDGVEGHIRYLPFYFDLFNGERRHQVSPLNYTYQARSGTKVDWQFNVVLPSYVGLGSERDYFGVGFPLYWKSRNGLQGWDLFLPLYYSFFSAASYGFHVLPLVSYNNFPSQKQLWLLGPTFVYRRYYGYDGERTGSGTSLLWPLITAETRSDGYHFRLLPLFWTSRRQDERDFLLFPFWYRQWGGGRAQNYFFLAYGRYESELLNRDFYAMGSYVNTEERDRDGEVFRRRHDILWSLLSLQENDRTGETHQRFLPLGFWRTRGVRQDRTVLGPFYYGHRIDTEEGSHHLRLVLGNLWMSKEVRVPVRLDASPRAGPDETAAVGEAGRIARPPPGPEAGEEAGAPAGKGGEARVVEKVISRERGILWPLTRWKTDEEGFESAWAIPFYYRKKTTLDESLGLFPLFFTDRMEDRYRPSYFRYFYLLDRERWPTGRRWSVGQLLFDWMHEELSSTTRWRFLYPIFEYQTNPESFRYQVTPLMQGEGRDDGSERSSSHFLFPLFWKGKHESREEDGSYTPTQEHFYLFPLYGYNRKTLRTQHDFLLPFFHIQHGEGTFKFQARPFFFFRNDPEELSVRLWPLHSHEAGEAAGSWWVSKYLYLSKSAFRHDRWSVRIDPFLFRAGRDPERSGVAALFELWAYDREGAETSFRLLPLTYGYSRREEAGVGVLPIYYSRNFGESEIDFWAPWRFLFLTNHLRNENYRYTSVLGLLGEYQYSPRRPAYSDFRMLFRIFQNTQTESSRILAFYPFFYYLRDDAALRKEVFSILPLFYRYQEVAGHGRHYIFWFIPIGGS